MALAYTIRVREHADETTYHDFKKIDGVLKSWAVQNLRRKGCGAGSFTAVLEDWSIESTAGGSTPEALCVPDNIVEFWVRLGGDGAIPVIYTGIIDRIELEGTPPSHKLRTFTLKGLWFELENPGCKVLKLYENMTVKAIVQSLIGDPISDETDVSSSTSEVDTGAALTIVRTLFEDTDAGKAIEKLAGVYKDTVYGVDAARKLYFRDETSESAAASWTFQIGEEDDNVKMVSRKQEIGRQANYFIIEGREAKDGNPMTIVEYDPALDGANPPRVRAVRLRAPELVTGANLVRWGEYLVAKEKDAQNHVALDVTKLQDKTDAAITIEEMNGNLAINDKDSAELGTYPVHAITYKLNGGAIDATFDLGDSLDIDLADALGVRELLRDVAVHAAKEFTNEVEASASGDDWLDVAYRHFAGTCGMRNCWRAALDRIDRDDDEDGPVLLDHADTYKPLVLESGISSTRAGAYTGEFVSRAVPMGKAYNEFAVLANYGHRVFLRDDPGGDRQKHFEEHHPASTSSRELDWRTGESSIYPYFPFYNLPPGNYFSMLFCNKRISYECDIIAEFTWGIPFAAGTGATYLRRYIYFDYTDDDNYFRVRLEKVADDKMQVSLRKEVNGGEDIAFSFSITVNSAGTDDIRITIDRMTYLSTDRILLTAENITKGTSASRVTDVHWYHRNNTPRWGFGIAAQGADEDSNDEWHITKVTFANCTIGHDEWRVSRDGTENWEPSGAPYFDAIAGTAKDLGAYAGGGTEDENVYIKGEVAFPAIIKGIAVGWK